MKVGDKVVCIDDRPNKIGETPNLKEGNTYTINKLHYCGGVLFLGIKECDEFYYGTFRFQKPSSQSDAISTEASRSLVKTLFIEKIGTNNDKYLEEERELITNAKF